MLYYLVLINLLCAPILFVLVILNAFLREETDGQIDMFADADGKEEL